MTRTVADSLAAGMKTEDMDAVIAQLQVQIQSRQQTRNKAEDVELAIQTMQTTRTMARLGVHSSDVSDTLCQALQNLIHPPGNEAIATTDRQTGPPGVGPADCQSTCRFHRQRRQYGSG